MIAAAVQLLGLVLLVVAGALVAPALGFLAAGAALLAVGVSMEGDR